MSIDLLSKSLAGRNPRKDIDSVVADMVMYASQSMMIKPKTDESGNEYFEVLLCDNGETWKERVPAW